MVYWLTDSLIHTFIDSYIHFVIKWKDINNNPWQTLHLYINKDQIHLIINLCEHFIIRTIICLAKLSHSSDTDLFDRCVIWRSFKEVISDSPYSTCLLAKPTSDPIWEKHQIHWFVDFKECSPQMSDLKKDCSLFNTRGIIIFRGWIFIFPPTLERIHCFYQLQCEGGEGYVFFHAK